MTVGGNTLYGKQTSIHFKIRNISSIHKKLNILGVPIFFGQVRDLLANPNISEADIKEALIKGDLANKIRKNEIEIVSSSINLLQFDDEQRAFILDAKAEDGVILGVEPEKIAKDAGLPYVELGPLGDDVPPSSFFFDVDGAPSYTDINGDPHHITDGGGGSGPYPYIQFNQEYSGEYALNSLYVNNENGNLLFINNDDELYTIKQADGGDNTNYQTFNSYNGMVPQNTLFINGNNESLPLSYRNTAGDIINLEAGGQDVVEALSTNDQTVDFNYQQLVNVAPPMPYSLQGAVNISWANAQYLNTIDMIIYGADGTEAEPSTELSNKPWQGLVQTNLEAWTIVELPHSPEEGDVVDCHVAPGASCLNVQLNGGDDIDALFGAPSYVRFKYENGGWGWGEIEQEEWIDAVNRRATKHSIHVFENNFSLQDRTYNGNVVGLGDIYIDNNIVIKGNFNVFGTIRNPNGYSLTVNGDLTSAAIDFDPDNIDGSGQGNLEVRGNLHTTSINFAVQRFDDNEAETFYPSLYVAGDLIVNGNVDGTGYTGAPGLNIEVYGDARFDQLDISSGNSNESFGPGAAGEMSVGGNLSCGYFTSSGGSYFGGIDPIPEGSNGGYLYVMGNVLNGDFTLEGGDAFSESSIITGNAGSGGTLEVSGFAHLNSIGVNGGFCNSTSPEHFGGSGGSIYIGGDLTSMNSSSIEAKGGFRSGTLTDAASFQTSNGGIIEVYGNLYVPATDVDLSGGHNQCSSDFTPSQAGNGGVMTIYGNVVCRNITLEGGSNYFGHAGHGGQFTVFGNLSIGSSESSVINMAGGGGNSTEGANFSGFGGDGGALYVKGDILVSEIHCNGGSGRNNNGGQGNNVNCDGKLKSNIINTYGGDCISTNPDHSPGYGGDINAFYGLHVSDHAYLYAGSSIGTTPYPGIAAYGGNGGDILVRMGDIHMQNANLSGGSLSTTYKSGAAGHGGMCRAYNGNIQIIDTINCNGGNCNGGTAGNGGSIIGNYIQANNININGGNSIEAPGDAEQSTAGSGGTLYIGNGCYISVLNMIDGSLGDEPTNEIALSLTGHCNIVQLNMQDRTQAVIKPGPNSSCVLLISAMSEKDTLNFPNGIPTSPLTGLYDGSIFKFGYEKWYKIEGTDLSVPP